MKKTLSLSLAIGAALAGALWPQRAVSHDALTTTVQFDREIVRILNAHCVMCHDVNGPSFPLDTYEQTFLLRREIRVDVIARHMSPWAAVSGYGSFANDNSLTLREIQFFISWAEGWGPRNSGVVLTGVQDRSSQPQAVQAHANYDRWLLGKPNQLVELPPRTIEPQQMDEVKRTIVDLKLPTDRWLSGLEYKPGDHRVVHSASFFVEETGQWIGSWTPWYGYVNLPKGLAYRLKPGSHLVADIHYYPAKEKVIERGSLGLFFAEQAPSKTLSELVLESKGEVPANSTLRKFQADTKLDADTNILALSSEIRPGMKSLEVYGRKPDGTTQVLLFAKDFSLEWPTPYVLEKPVRLPKGTDLVVSASYANAGPASQPGGIRLIVSGYRGSALTSEKPGTKKTPTAAPVRYKLAGTVQTVNARENKLVVQHSAIPGFMPAMTMSYDAGKQEDLREIAAGDDIRADLVVIGAQMRLENIHVVSHTR